MQEAAREKDPEVDAAIAEVERLLREARQPLLPPADPVPPRSAPPDPPRARPRRWFLGRLFGLLRQEQPRVAQTVATELRATPCPSCGQSHALFRRLEVHWTQQELASGQALRRVEVCCPDTGQLFTLPVRFVQS